MTLIGYLHFRKDPAKVSKSYPLAVVAKAEGAELVYFSPGRVCWEDETIRGMFYEAGRWVERTTRFPDVIYNEGQKLTTQNLQTVQKLRARIPFTSYGVGDKMVVHDKILTAGQFAQYVIPSVEVRTVDEVWALLDRYRDFVLKPIRGRQGNGVLYIQQLVPMHSFCLHEGADKRQVDAEEFRSFIQTRLAGEIHLIQRYINCKTKTGAAYDFRLHVQKDGAARWVVVSIYPRIAAPGQIVSNISNGGYTNYAKPFLQQEFGEQWFEMKRYLEHFSLVLAKHLDDIYGASFDELGIDVGLDEQQKLWLYEVNWKPGAPPTFYLELDVVRNTVHYAMYLAEKHKVR
ncbi:YheC/D-like protein [Tumebacillus permanentifrigoris]|uniref:YheC/D-like protein n=1 Tax=Tumebacillus permanentifrigoris TaxID=378543 RepID=A0A316D786_9BACL|nr:YheC/D-like protein [Tumebacillus permanentifrigoris]